MLPILLGLALGVLGATCLLYGEIIPGVIMLSGATLLMFYGANRRP